MRYLVDWACAILLLDGIWGYPMYQEHIPNGNIVPHPCKDNFIWYGVGHEDMHGGGARNTFGLDFEKAGEQWSVELCHQDSDGDGKTNGEELGDPNCVWSRGQNPSRSSGLSHPGVCDPVNIPQCTGKNNWVQCSVEEFKCAAIDDIETKNLTVRFPVTEIPLKETTYMCMQFALPQDGDYHLVATKPIIDNANAMHHIVTYGCKKGSTIPLNQPYDCDMLPSAECTDIIGLWAVGSSGQCHHSSSGFRIGVNGYKIASFQFHWDNTKLIKGTFDSSGMTLYYTSKLRPYDAGILMIGQTYIDIPPGETAVTAIGTCPGECTRTMMTGNINIITANNHMHYLGIQQWIELLRNGTELQTITLEENYSFESPVTFKYDIPIEVRPGDELKTTCVYSSTSRLTTTTYGRDTSQEMCFGFITYYPKENFPTSDCSQWNNVSMCDWNKDEIQGCRHRDILNTSIPESATIYKSVMENCATLGKCQKECLETVMVIKRHPCFQGDMDKRQRLYIARMDHSALKSKLLEFYAALDSCNVELALLDPAGLNKSKINCTPSEGGH